ncbi:protein of unknown function [Methylocella tundrae]|uniref:Uncharacterized protein n=1 Tax=Methylocella tundrae TaxID=227605 RepID=A0A4U8YWK6_METTU|nr:protein of unknown function [Methylocella tundrae]
MAGAAGGAFGLAGLPVELPFTTTVMLRSIADVARSEGEDLTDPDVALACLEVFALGGDAGSSRREERGGALETGYFAVRVMLARSVSESARHFLDRGLTEQAAPMLVRLIAQISTRFGVVVSQKARGSKRPNHRRRQRRGHQLRIRRSLPDAGARPFHRSPAGAYLWSEPGSGRI